MIRRLQITLLALFVSVWAMASETSVKNADGVEIWYNFDSSAMTASVTYKGEAYYTYYDEYTGNVVIPSKVTYNGEEYSVTKIGDWVFYGCNSLTSITIPESVTEIGEKTFIFCSSLTSITLHEGLTEIGESAFYGCSSLTSITIPESVTEIGSNAFLDCSSLTSITIPKGVTKIGDGAFYNCSSLTSVTISEGVTEIGDGAFYNCSSLKSITIPESVTEIGSLAFHGCSSLKSITIPEGVKSIGAEAFKGCYKLYEVYNKSNLTITAGSSENGGVAYYAKNVYTDESGESKIKTVGDYLFYVDEDNIELLEYLGDETAITLPSDYEGKNYKIGDRAFEGCGSLTSITIPEGVTEIGEGAFRVCSSLTSITIPESVTSIGHSAFEFCSSLTSITLPEGVTEIGNNAFRGCGSLTSIDVALDNNSYTSINGVLFTKDKTILIKYPEGKKDVTSYAIPKGVTEIENNAFCGCNSLTSITLPEGVTSIGDDAFSYCSSLTSITIPKGVTEIGGSAFYDCSSLTSITIPESVTSIGESAFSYCTSLTSVTIPKNVTSIGENAFGGCRSLTSITIPKGVTSIGDNAFRDCSSLTSITIPESVTEIGSYAFNGCFKLYEVYDKSNLTITAGSSDNGYVAYYAKNVYTDESGESKLKTVGDYIFYVDEDNIELLVYLGDETAITLPSDYEGKNYKIGDNAFRDCSSLTSITIPEGVISIGEGAFVGCSNHDVYNRSKLYLTLGSEENGCVAYHANNVNNIYFETTDSYIFYVKEDDVELIKHIGGFDGADVVINEYVEDENIYSTDFSDGLSLIGWGGSSTRTVVNEEMVLTNPVASEYWAVQFAYDHVEPFVAGRKYVISFKVKGSVAGTISAGLQNINGYTSAGEFGGIDVTTDWKEVRLTCTCTDGAATRLIFNVGTFVGDLYIDDFRFCSLFYKLTLPAKYKERVYDISRNAFEDDTYMTEIEIPEGVMAIGKDAMKGTALYEDESNWENGLLYVDGCLVAAKSSEVSELCVIEDGVRIIADNTFENITTLKNVIISADVRRIGNAAFNDCSGLTSITSMSTTPPEIGNKETFCNVDKSIPLYVPAESVEAYKSAEYWEDFTNIQGIDDVTPISDVVADSVSIRLIGNSLIVEGAESYAVYALSGQCLGKVESLERGVYIVVADGVSKRIVVK